MAGSSLSIALIGTGIMGAPIAGHLLGAGYPLTVHNRTKSRADELIARGAVWADSAAAAAEGADVILTMVGYPHDVEDIYLASDGLLARSRRGATLIDLTTSSPALARDIAEAARVEGRFAFDCPVTGGEAGARAGTLTAIAGASERDVDALRPVLETFTSRIFCFDRAGSGQAAKLANQVALSASMVGMADAIAFARQSGLDLTRTREMILSGTGASGALSQLAPLSLAGDWKPGFMVKHFLKDLGLALADVEEREITLPGVETAFTLYDMLEAIGGGDLGTQAVTLLYQEEAAAVAAGLDWSRYTAEHEHGHDGCDCDCGHEHERGRDDCGCGRTGGDDGCQRDPGAVDADPARDARR